MRWVDRALICVCVAAAAACTGTGDGGGRRADEATPLCERTCGVLLACTDEYATLDGCLAECSGFETPEPLVAECLACMEEVGCAGVELGCRSGPACDLAWDLRVRAAGIAGVAARVMAVEAHAGEHWIDAARDVEIREGGFDLLLAGALPGYWGIPFDAAVVVDVDGDGVCTPQSDRAFRTSLGVPQRHVEVEVRALEEATADDCALWASAPTEIVLEGVGLEALEGETVIAAPVWFDETFISVGRFVSARVEAGRFRVRLGSFGDYVEEMAPGSEIHLAWMADLDGDWTCTAADAGGHGRMPMEPTGLVQRVEAVWAPAGSAPCELLRGLGYDLRLSGKGFEAWEGRTAEAVLYDGRRALGGARGTVRGGAVELVFDGLAVAGRSYRASIWIDADADFVCEAPPDLVWDEEIGEVWGSVVHTLTLPSSPGSGEACSWFHGGR